MSVNVNLEVYHYEDKIRKIINKDFNICCEKCHSINYSIYPTSIGFYWICRECRWVWNSGFDGKVGMEDQYDYETKCIGNLTLFNKLKMLYFRFLRKDVNNGKSKK